MINLLPVTHKREIRAGRVNILLVRYTVILVFAAAFLAIANVVAFYYLSAVKTNAEKTISENVQKESSYDATKAQAETFRSELSNAKTIFDDQISYSKAILEISQLIPEGAALDTLKLDSSSFSSTLKLSVKLSGESAAKSLLANFNASQYVTSVKKDDITINTSDSYPYTMEISVTLNKQVAKR